MKEGKDFSEGVDLTWEALDGDYSAVASLAKSMVKHEATLQYFDTVYGWTSFLGYYEANLNSNLALKAAASPKTKSTWIAAIDLLALALKEDEHDLAETLFHLIRKNKKL